MFEGEKLAAGISIKLSGRTDSTGRKKIQKIFRHFTCRRNYSRELQKEISKKCKENGIETEDIVVHINGDQITAVISTAGNITQEQERGIRDGLARDFGIEEKNCQLLMGKDEQTTLAGDSASGPFTDGNRISHIENRD